MSSSREGTPDWLTNFKPPSYSTVLLSSDSESSPDDRSIGKDKVDNEEPSDGGTSRFLENNDQGELAADNADDSTFEKTYKRKAKKRQLKVENDTPKKKKKKKSPNKGDIKKGNEIDIDVEDERPLEKSEDPRVTNPTLWTLSSDSESSQDDISIKEALLRHKEASVCKKSQEKGKHKVGVLSDSGVNGLTSETSLVTKSTEERLESEDSLATVGNNTSTQQNERAPMKEGDVAKVEVSAQKHIEPQVSSSRLPLVLADKVQLSKALVECEGESIDLSGDVGSVGRIVISDDPSGSHELLLDLKGTIYRTTIVPSRTLCVVSFGQSEAKIEAIMNDFIQLKPESNVYEAETMVEGTLDGFSFDSEDEADKLAKGSAGQVDKKDGAEEQTNGKLNASEKKKFGAGQKRKPRATGGKPPTKVRKKPQASKKVKTKK